MVTNFTEGNKRHTAAVVFEAPIKQSSPIRELDRLVSHQTEYTDECNDIMLNQ